MHMPGLYRVSSLLGLATPTIRQVARIELPSTKAARIALRRSVLKRFMLILCLTAHAL